MYTFLIQTVDFETDKQIQKVIGECFAECTVITVAHRLSTVADADTVIVMDRGKVSLITIMIISIVSMSLIVVIY
jgi:ABC-type transport system involved in Fe-S cluster assembly fused permease/ATPase subunit